jgi:hypothetical protein
MTLIGPGNKPELREGPSTLHPCVENLKTSIMSGRARRWRQIGTAALTGVIVLSDYAGVVGLVGGAISFGENINAQAPFHSQFLLAWLCRSLYD